MATLLKELISWLKLADYDDASRHASEQIVARYARGNVALQNGWFMDKSDLARLSEAGDRAIANPKLKAFARHA